jgi:hypothetical protein
VPATHRTRPWLAIVQRWIGELTNRKLRRRGRYAGESA